MEAENSEVVSLQSRWIYNSFVSLFFFCILLFLFVSYTRDKQRNTIMLHTKKDGKKTEREGGEVKKPITL